MASAKEVLTELSGISGPAFDAILADVKRNQKVLASCSLHEFEKTGPRFNDHLRCKHCGGTIDPVHELWYRKGLEHGRKEAGGKSDG